LIVVIYFLIFRYKYQNGNFINQYKETVNNPTKRTGRSIIAVNQSDSLLMSDTISIN